MTPWCVVAKLRVELTNVLQFNIGATTAKLQANEAL